MASSNYQLWKDFLQPLKGIKGSKQNSYKFEDFEHYDCLSTELVYALNSEILVPESILLASKKIDNATHTSVAVQVDAPMELDSDFDANSEIEMNVNSDEGTDIREGLSTKKTTTRTVLQLDKSHVQATVGVNVNIKTDYDGDEEEDEKEKKSDDIDEGSFLMADEDDDTFDDESKDYGEDDDIISDDESEEIDAEDANKVLFRQENKRDVSNATGTVTAVKTKYSETDADKMKRITDLHETDKLQFKNQKQINNHDIEDKRNEGSRNTQRENVETIRQKFKHQATDVSENSTVLCLQGKHPEEGDFGDKRGNSEPSKLKGKHGNKETGDDSAEEEEEEEEEEDDDDEEEAEGEAEEEERGDYNDDDETTGSEKEDDDYEEYEDDEEDREDTSSITHQENEVPFDQIFKHQGKDDFNRRLADKVLPRINEKQEEFGHKQSIDGSTGQLKLKQRKQEEVDTAEGNRECKKEKYECKKSKVKEVEKGEEYEVSAVPSSVQEEKEEGEIELVLPANRQEEGDIKVVPVVSQSDQQEIKEVEANEEENEVLAVSPSVQRRIKEEKEDEGEKELVPAVSVPAEEQLKHVKVNNFRKRNLEDVNTDEVAQKVYKKEGFQSRESIKNATVRPQKLVPVQSAYISLLSAVHGQKLLPADDKEKALNRPQKRVNDKSKYVSQWTFKMFTEYFHFTDIVKELKLPPLSCEKSLSHKVYSHYTDVLDLIRDDSDNPLKESDVRILFDGLLMKICHKHKLHLHTEKEFKLSSLPSGKFDYLLTTQSGKPIGCIETKSQANMDTKAFVQAVLQLCSLQQIAIQHGIKAETMPVFSILTDSLRFVFIQLQGRELRLEQIWTNSTENNVLNVRQLKGSMEKDFKPIIGQISQIISMSTKLL